MAILGYWGQNEIMKPYRNLAHVERAVPTDSDLGGK